MKKHILALILLVVALSACTQNALKPTTAPTAAPAQVETSPTNTPSPVPTATSLPTATITATLPPTAIPSPTVLPPYGPNNFPDNINPLTGLPVADPALLERRPLGVKLQLYPRGQRPVWGASLADIVYDYYQNDGLTRLHALFYGNDAEKVMPIRSARYFDETIIRMYKSIFAFGGADQRVLDRLYAGEYADRLVVEGNGNCPPMCREDPNGFNFLYTNTAELSKYITDKGVSNGRQNLDGMSFDINTPAGGQPGKSLTTRYSISAYNRWEHDPATGRYLRSQDTQEDNSGQGEAFAPMMDGLTGTQIAADNVVVLPLVHQLNATGKGPIDILLSGSGTAYVFRDGQVYRVLWNRPDKDATLFFTYENGTPFPLKPGSTWIQVVGQSSPVTTNPEGDWRVVFQVP
jgi:hypothetical protein